MTIPSPIKASEIKVVRNPRKGRDVARLLRPLILGNNFMNNGKLKEAPLTRKLKLILTTPDTEKSTLHNDHSSKGYGKACESHQRKQLVCT